MNSLKKKRIKQVLCYGWKDATEIAKMNNVKKSRIAIFFDILSCFRRYYLFSNQYKKNVIWEKTAVERDAICQSLGDSNLTHDYWVGFYYENWKFLDKYTQFKWQTSPRMIEKRNDAYRKRYGFGKNLSVQYGVTLISEHFCVGKITAGDNILLARNCDIDITGDIEIGNNVGILEGAKILTHAHDSYHFMKDSDLIPFSNRAYKTNLKIGDNVSICAHAVILPGVGEIGENSIISAGAIVNRPVPANVIVAGNPATVVRKIPATVKIRKHEQ